MAKSVKLDFSRFFPSDQSFVALKANAARGDDFYVNLSFGDGDNKVTYWINEYNTKESIKQMQAVLEATEKALEFAQKAMAMPTDRGSNWFDTLMSEVKPETKKPAKKKAASKK
jgi:hypothetical protein